MNRKRLLNVAKALRESTTPEQFTMSLYGHPCGTPACAIGHYAARRDLQSDFVLSIRGYLRMNDGGKPPTARDIANHFSITLKAHDELFESRGCGDAKTAIEAAEYIENFVAEHGAA